MLRKTFVTKMPNKAGAFLAAARIIAGHGGNIVRVSYNKAVDLNTLFIDVAAGPDALEAIGAELDQIGYLSREIPEISVIMVEIMIPDRPGALMPVLKILDGHDVNISYMNAVQGSSDHQRFVMGLLIDDPGVIAALLEAIGALYAVNVIGYDDTVHNYDNSIFYIKLANEVKKALNLSEEKTIEFISEANRVLQMLQRTEESPAKVFEAIREFVAFINAHKGARFKPEIHSYPISKAVTLIQIKPVCGSNTYLLKSSNAVTLVDTGYARYRDEMFELFRALVPGWDRAAKNIYITHADVDHCGLLAHIDGARLYLNEKSMDSLKRQRAGILDDRELKEYGLGYSKLARLISDYTPPPLDNAAVIDRGTPKAHDALLKIGQLAVADVAFDILEGPGGHLPGELIYVSAGAGVLFTGDNYLNIGAFTEEEKYFNALAPYLMKSVNTDSEKAAKTRAEIVVLIERIQSATGRPCLICGGHGPVSVLENGRLRSYDDALD